MPAFQNPEEFKRAFQHVFELINEHPEVGRPLHDAHAPHRFVITDLGLELNVDAAEDGHFLRWVWGPAPWKPAITLSMTSETANRYFQGKENVALAVALGRVKVAGPPLTILKLAPVTKPIHPIYREWLAQAGLKHLLA